MEEKEKNAIFDITKNKLFFGNIDKLHDWNDGEWMELWEQRAENAGVNVVDSLIAKDYPDEEASAECMRLGSLLA